MRITTYEKGGNLLNPFIKLSIFLIVLCLFVIPVSAVSDNFNDQEIISDWTIDSGSWLFSNSSSIEGADDYYVYTVHATTSWGGTSNIEYEIYRSQSSDNKYYEIDIKTTGTQYSGMYAKSILVFESNGIDENSIYIGSSTTSFGLYSDTFTISSIALSQNTWYHVEIITLGSNIQVDVYDMDDNLIGRRTTTYIPISDSDQLSLKSNLIDGHADYSASMTSYFDNLYTSSTVDTGAVSSIYWESATYTEGDTGKYTWNLDNDAWYSFLYKHKIVIEKDGTEIYSTTIGKSGDRYYDFDTAGTYTAKLLSSKIIFTNWVTVVSDNTHAYYMIDSFINVPQTAPQRTNFTVNYLYGSTPSNGLILMKKLDETTGIYKTVEFDLLDSDKQGGTTYSRNMSLHSTGTYKITLVHDEQVDEIYDVIEITSLYVPPIETVGNSSISSDKSIYAIGETIFAQYAVDYTNFTTYNVNMEVYNIDKDIVSYSTPTIDQISYISQTISISNEYFTGSHSLRLTSYDNTGSKVDVLASKNITIGLVNDDGFGLSLSKYDVMQLEMFVIKAISPTSANIRVWSVERDTQVGGLIIINGSTYLNYAIPRTGNYEITLSSGGFEIAKQYITVHEGFVDGDIIDEGAVIPDTTFQDNTTSLLNSPYLIGLFIMCVFLAIGATNGIGGTIVTGSVGLGIVCYMGIFPWILLVIEVLVAAVLMAKGIINLSGD